MLILCNTNLRFNIAKSFVYSICQNYKRKTKQPGTSICDAKYSIKSVVYVV